jgi:hypothetical protein
MIDIIDDALEPVKEWMLTLPWPLLKDGNPSEDIPPPHLNDRGWEYGATRIRIDSEVPARNTDHALTIPPEVFTMAVYNEMRNYITDLVKYGDRESSDPYLKVMDGAVKLGKTPVDFEIVNVFIYNEWRTARVSWEQMAYVSFKVQFK